MKEETNQIIEGLKERHFDIVYLTPEILFSPNTQSGAGGLGVVAGSFLEELETNHPIHRKTALVVSVYCSHGYQEQCVRSIDGGIMESRYVKDTYGYQPQDTGMRIQLQLAGKKCHVAIRVPRDKERINTALLLLDTDIPENPEEFRMITRVLYGEGHATAFFGERWHNTSWLRLLQACVLGIASYKLLERLEIRCEVLHLNESHPVFFLVHKLGVLSKERSFEHALVQVHDSAVLTNHTILDSGNKWYPISEIHTVAGVYEGFDPETLKKISQKGGYNFSMTDAALFLVGQGRANGVSVHHTAIANTIWPGYEIIPITNGVSAEYQHPLFRNLDRPEDIPDVKREMKVVLLEALNAKAVQAGWRPQIGIEELQKSVLITWARRCQEYKRSGLMWHTEELPLVKTLLDWGYITIVWGGYAHPDDVEMMNMWNMYWQRFRSLPNTMPVFNYTLELMRPTLKAGSDIWFNTPMFGHEACGTSWMSAMLNCALVVSVPDGGIREAQHYVRFGSEEEGNWHVQYREDAKMLWQNTLPAILDLRKRDPRLLAMLYDAKCEAEEKFCATRMVSDYINKLYRLK